MDATNGIIIGATASASSNSLTVDGGLLSGSSLRFLGGINNTIVATNGDQVVIGPIAAFNALTSIQLNAGTNNSFVATGAGTTVTVNNGSSYVYGAESLFSYVDVVSPDFGPGSYMGFQTSQGNYGWLEVTWDSASADFEIFSGAYESTPNVAIRAGAGAAIPEPGTWAAAALLAGGAAFMRWRKRAKVS
jgi:hypothetical protein